jgi:hypothetical protein
LLQNGRVPEGAALLSKRFSSEELITAGARELDVGDAEVARS